MTFALPILAANAPKIGANMPHINICMPIAKPNSVIVHCKSCTKKSVNSPKTIRSPINVATIKQAEITVINAALLGNCLLYTSDAADDSLRVDLGGRRIIKKERGSVQVRTHPRSSRELSMVFFQAEDGIRDRSPSRGLGDVYKRQGLCS